MNDLQIFRCEEFGKVRTLEENGKVLFCGKDVAEALGYEKARNAIKKYCVGAGALKRGVGVATGIKQDGSPAMQTVEMTFIDEGNLYRLITHSRLPSAQKFERWVFDEVLPSIRKMGTYSTADSSQQEFDLKMLNALSALTDIVLDLRESLAANTFQAQRQPTPALPQYAPNAIDTRDVLVYDAIRSVPRRNVRNSIEILPNEILCQVILKLAAGTAYKDISLWLEGKGYSSSKSAIGRFRKSVEVFNVLGDKIEVLMKNKNLIVVYPDGTVEKVFG